MQASPHTQITRRVDFEFAAAAKGVVLEGVAAHKLFVTAQECELVGSELLASALLLFNPVRLTDTWLLLHSYVIVMSIFTMSDLN